jgi:hypothetical protein
MTPENICFAMPGLRSKLEIGLLDSREVSKNAQVIMKG